MGAWCLEQPRPEAVIDQAIAKKFCIAAIYNKVAVTLAPHSLFTKHDELYLRAVTVEHDGRKPRETKLGTFKLAGLSEVNPTRKLFSPRSLFPGEPLPQAVAG